MSEFEDALAAIRARGPAPLEDQARMFHRPMGTTRADGSMGSYCQKCRDWWPCLTIKMAEEIEKMRATARLQAEDAHTTTQEDARC